jgi:hypothetical protein
MLLPGLVGGVAIGNIVTRYLCTMMCCCGWKLSNDCENCALFMNHLRLVKVITMVNSKRTIVIVDLCDQWKGLKSIIVGKLLRKYGSFGTVVKIVHFLLTV